MMNRCILILVLLLVGIGCNFASCGKGEVVFAATEVGTPTGDKVTKAIDSSGGALTSPDGRLTLTIPPNAVSSSTEFSMQPITNNAAGGIGPGYRLGPDGKTFSVPLKLTIHYDEHELEGTIPAEFAIAYQDKDGRWKRLRGVKVDEATRTLEVNTTHFTDVAFYTGLKISPERATVRVKGVVSLQVFTCRQRTVWIVTLPMEAQCTTVSLSDVRIFPAVPEVDGIQYGDAIKGTVKGEGAGMQYTAPEKKPSPDTVRVGFPYHYSRGEDEDHPGSTADVDRNVFATIKIVDSGWKASGQDGPTKYSGTICSLEEPFVLTVDHPLYTTGVSFTPTSRVAGNAKYQGSAGGGIIKFKGSGPYTVEGMETDSPYLLWSVTSTAKIPVISTTGSGAAHIKLEPLDTPECNPPPPPAAPAGRR